MSRVSHTSWGRGGGEELQANDDILAQLLSTCLPCCLTICKLKQTPAGETGQAEAHTNQCGIDWFTDIPHYFAVHVRAAFPQLQCKTTSGVWQAAVTHMSWFDCVCCGPSTQLSSDFGLKAASAL